MQIWKCTASGTDVKDIDVSRGHSKMIDGPIKSTAPWTSWETGSSDDQEETYWRHVPQSIQKAASIQLSVGRSDCRHEHGGNKSYTSGSSYYTEVFSSVDSWVTLVVGCKSLRHKLWLRMASPQQEGRYLGFLFLFSERKWRHHLNWFQCVKPIARCMCTLLSVHKINQTRSHWSKTILWLCCPLSFHYRVLLYSGNHIFHFNWMWTRGDNVSLIALVATND